VRPHAGGLKNSPGAIVFGGDSMVALGIARSLGRQGVPVWLITVERIPAASRYCSRYSRWSWLDEDDAAQLGRLLEVTRGARPGWMLCPTGDNEALLVARHHELLSRRFSLTTAPWHVVRWAVDKRLTYRLADDLAVDHPWTIYPRTPADVADIDGPFPVVLKPAMKRERNAFTTDRGWPAHSREMLVARYMEACRLLDPELVIVQELIPGGGERQYSYGGLWNQGEEVAWLVARRIRQYPPEFGRGSTFVETAEESTVTAAARRLLTAIGYSGLAEVEFKQDPRTGQFKLLDINPRAWAWHSLAQRAGVDLPFLQWCLLGGYRLQAGQARHGVRWMHLPLDARVAVLHLREGRLKLRDYLRSFRPPLELGTFAWSDPLPALYEARQLIGTVAGRYRAGPEERKSPAAESPIVCEDAPTSAGKR
jgi:D-aspartate ligase